MANVHKGEVGFDLDGNSYILRLGNNALCELEGKLGCGINAVIKQLANPEVLQLTTVRAVFWAGLQKHHRGVTIEQAGDMVESLGMAGSCELIGKALTAAFPNPDTTAGPLMPGPMTDPAGTGLTSSANGANLASPTKPSGSTRRATSLPTSPPVRHS